MMTGVTLGGANVEQVAQLQTDDYYVHDLGIERARAPSRPCVRYL
jgi:hypothetical protein